MHLAARDTDKVGMKDSDIYCKTAAGLAEVRDRALKLPQRLRTMLIMVDGVRTVSQLRAAAGTLGVGSDFLDTLLAQGLVELDASRRRTEAPSPPPAAASATPVPVSAAPEMAGMDATERFRATVKFLNDSAVDLLGFRAFLWTLKLEKCYRAEDLLALLPDFSAAIAKSKGPDMARALEARAREMLGA